MRRNVVARRSSFVIRMAVVVVFLLSTIHYPLSAVYAAPAQPSASGKIGYVNVAKAFDEYQKTKDQDKLLEDKQNKKQSERDQMVQEVRKLKDELELLSDKAREEKQDFIDEKIKKLQDFDRAVTGDLKRDRDKMARDILKEIDTAIQELGKKENYALIINDRVLLYSEDGSDLTDKVIASLNGRYKK